MLTGMMAVRNIVYHEKNNLWIVNGEQEYHEADVIGRKPTGQQERPSPWPQVLNPVTPYIDDALMGISLGLVTALFTYFLTMFLL